MTLNTFWLKRISFLSALILVPLIVLSLPHAAANTSSLAFQEVWAYLMKGEETYFRPSLPVTDIGYFSAKVEDDGTLTASVPRPVLTAAQGSPRIHLVVSMIGSKMLTHFVLREDLPLRGRIIESIVALAEDYDGVQIDFESVRFEDRDLYLSFLRSVKSALPQQKIFSVAVPARWWEKDNAFPYPEIAALADRVVIMAYDEHWRTGTPGPIASLPWCEKVLAYAQQRVPPEKLIMGLPFYGRAWQVEEHARSLKYPQTVTLCKDIQCEMKTSETGEPYFEYQVPATVRVHFENTQSLFNKMALYSRASVTKLAFWRLGQEPPDIWTYLSARGIRK